MQSYWSALQFAPTNLPIFLTVACQRHPTEIIVAGKVHSKQSSNNIESPLSSSLWNSNIWLSDFLHKTCCSNRPFCFPNTCDDPQEVWTFGVFIRKTACEHENVQLWKKMLSWESSHDLYWQNKIDKRKRLTAMSMNRHKLDVSFKSYTRRCLQSICRKKKKVSPTLTDVESLP